MSTSSEDDDEWNNVVFELSYETRVQYAGEDAPDSFLTCNPGSGVNVEETELDYTTKLCGEKVEYLVNKSYEELSIQRSKMKEKGVVFIEPLGVLASNRELVLELMMEKYEVPSYYSAPSPIMSLYASGRGSGIIIQSGHSLSETITIYEGYAIPGSQKSSRICSGKRILQRLSGLLDNKYGYGIIENIKHNDMNLVEPFTEFTLPDGSTVKTNASITEGIKNEIFGDSGGIAEMTYHAIMAADIGFRRDIFVNVILSGGTTLMKGFPETFQAELRKVSRPRHSENLRIQTVSPPERKFSSWIGGSIVGSLSCYINAHISRECYEDCGPNIVHKYLPFGEVEILEN